MSRTALVIYFFRHIHDLYSDLFSFIGRYPVHFFVPYALLTSVKRKGCIVNWWHFSISIMASKKINLNSENVCDKYNLILSRKQMADDIVIVALQLNSMCSTETSTHRIFWNFQDVNHHSCFLVHDLFYKLEEL